MTTSDELKEEFLDFIKTKREELINQVDEETFPFLKTIAEPESKEDENYAQVELKSILNDRDDCDTFLYELENHIIEMSTVSKNSKKGKA